MIAGVISNQKVNPIVTELFIRGKKNLLQMHIFFLVNDTTLPSDDP